jgi:uncharacterized protein YcsI (UPF0317 family)
LQGRWRLLQQDEEPVATRHQDACSNPTVCQVYLQANVCSVSLDWKFEAFMVRSEAQDGCPRLVVCQLKSRLSNRTVGRSTFEATVRRCHAYLWASSISWLAIRLRLFSA